VLVTTCQVIATCLVLSVRGTLAGTAITALGAQIDQIGCSDAKDVQLDLTELCGVDARGLQVLIDMAEYVRARGGHLDITGASGPVALALASIPELDGVAGSKPARPLSAPDQRCERVNKSVGRTSRP
jgi:ABC-type transporter Mla MlaB component